jgi:LuxR family maltose regulon positive regulatory protein
MQQLGDGWWRDPLGRFGWNMVVREVALTESWDGSHADVREAELALSRDPERRFTMEGTRALGEALAGWPLAALRVSAGVRRSAEVASMTILRTELAAAEAIAHRELGERTRALAELDVLATAPAETMLHCRLLALTELVHAHLDVGDHSAARQAFDRAEALVRDAAFGSDAVSWLARAGVQLELAVGDLDSARRWTAQIQDPFWAGTGTARLHLARGDQRPAMDVLAGLEPRCVRHEVTLDLLRARAGVDRDEVLKCATTAVERAVEAGMLQTVASEGAGMLEIIEQAAWRVPPGWLDRVRRAVARSSRTDDGEQLGIDLTERERDVLRFLPSRLTIAEIAQELYVSVNTLKFHLKVIYRKLGVSSRAEAAEVARRLTEVRR